MRAFYQVTAINACFYGIYLLIHNRQQVEGKLRNAVQKHNTVLQSNGQQSA